MILTPSFVGDLTIQIQRCFDYAEFATTKTLQTGTFDFQDHPQRQKIGELAQHIFHHDHREKLQAVGSPEWDAFVLKSIEYGTQPVQMLADSPSRPGLEAILSSCLTGTWTAFETMAADLWESAINVHPSTLAELKGAKTRITKGSPSNDIDEDLDEDTKTAQSIPLSEVTRHQYKIENLMGTVLKTRRRFDSLGGIREAYSRAFSKKSDAIDGALRDPILYQLSAIRNLIVHRAGKVDTAYKSKSGNFEIPIAVINDHIAPDGIAVAEIITRTVKCAMNLSRAVDIWIEEN